MTTISIHIDPIQLTPEEFWGAEDEVPEAFTADECNLLVLGEGGLHRIIESWNLPLNGYIEVTTPNEHYKGDDVMFAEHIPAKFTSTRVRLSR